MFQLPKCEGLGKTSLPYIACSCEVPIITKLSLHVLIKVSVVSLYRFRQLCFRLLRSTVFQTITYVFIFLSSLLLTLEIPIGANSNNNSLCLLQVICKIMHNGAGSGLYFIELYLVLGCGGMECLPLNAGRLSGERCYSSMENGVVEPVRHSHIFQHDYNLCIRHLLGLTLLAMEVLWKLIYPRVVFKT